MAIKRRVERVSERSGDRRDRSALLLVARAEARTSARQRLDAADLGRESQFSRPSEK